MKSECLAIKEKMFYVLSVMGLFTAKSPPPLPSEHHPMCAYSTIFAS